MKKHLSVLDIGRTRGRRAPSGRHSTKPIEGNAVKFSVHRVGHEDYRRFDTILSHELVQNAGLETGDRVDLRFSADKTHADIVKVDGDGPATRLQKRRETARPHGMIAVRIPVTKDVSVPCVDAEIVRVRRGYVRVRVPIELRQLLQQAAAPAQG